MQGNSDQQAPTEHLRLSSHSYKRFDPAETEGSGPDSGWPKSLLCLCEVEEGLYPSMAIAIAGAAGKGTPVMD